MQCTEKFGWNNVRESSYIAGVGGGTLGPGQIGYSIFGYLCLLKDLKTYINWT
jgi:hypothetical protein